jgi:hypothetical protein
MFSCMDVKHFYHVERGTSFEGFALFSTLEGKKHMEDTRVNRKIMLKCITRNCDIGHRLDRSG